MSTFGKGHDLKSSGPLCSVHADNSFPFHSLVVFPPLLKFRGKQCTISYERKAVLLKKVLKPMEQNQFKVSFGM